MWAKGESTLSTEEDLEERFKSNGGGGGWPGCVNTGGGAKYLGGPDVGSSPGIPA